LPIHWNSGSLKINKLQAIENQKMNEFGLFLQSQQLYAISKSDPFTLSRLQDKASD
jgi:hypothetical protein